MINKLSNYIYDNHFSMTINDDKIYVVNYKRISSIDNSNISLYTKDKKIIISGNHLVLRKLLKEEMLILGNVSKIEVINEK